jgi:hypothetical protein
MELIMGKIQSRVLVFVSRLSSFVRLGLPFIAVRGVPTNYLYVPYKCGILTYMMSTLLGQVV